jgi:serine/threonine protein kinase
MTPTGGRGPRRITPIIDHASLPSPASSPALGAGRWTPPAARGGMLPHPPTGGHSVANGLEGGDAGPPTFTWVIDAALSGDAGPPKVAWAAEAALPDVVEDADDGAPPWNASTTTIMFADSVEGAPVQVCIASPNGTESAGAAVAAEGAPQPHSDGGELDVDEPLVTLLGLMDARDDGGLDVASEPASSTSSCGELLPSAAAALTSTADPTVADDDADDPFLMSHSALVIADDEGNDVVNGFILWEELGRGAAGVVYLALDDATGETKAIKVIDRCKVQRETAAGDEGLLTEVAVMKKIRHPHVVRLYECIDDPEADAVYHVMQYVPSGPIASLDDDGYCAPMALSTVAHYTLQLSHALRYMHGRGVAHGDIKPDNILVDDGERLAYFADFGVSRCFTSEAAPERQLSHRSDLWRRASTFTAGGSPLGTRTASATNSSASSALSAGPHPAGEELLLLEGATFLDSLTDRPDALADTPLGRSLLAANDSTASSQGTSNSTASSQGPAPDPRPRQPLGLGTPAFLSPEVVAGAPPSIAADRWAVGVTLYVMVFGRLPFVGDDYFDLKHNVVTEPVPFPPSSPAAQKWRRVILRLLEKDPARRLTAETLIRCRLLHPAFAADAAHGDGDSDSNSFSFAVTPEDLGESSELTPMMAVTPIRELEVGAAMADMPLDSHESAEFDSGAPAGTATAPPMRPTFGGAVQDGSSRPGSGVRRTVTLTANDKLKAVAVRRKTVVFGTSLLQQRRRQSQVALRDPVSDNNGDSDDSGDGDKLRGTAAAM